jgi:D-glycero-alpha-D-manno-heptose-7-phosphate kinase
MISFPISVRTVLEQNPITASAPCRIDSGGTWDIKAMALPFQGIGPVTINMALSLRTEVVISPHDEGRIMISSDGFDHTEEYPFDNVSFNPPFGLFFSAVTHFGFHGLQIKIRSDSPIQSALGGSSTALVALLKALSKLSALIPTHKAFSKKDILYLGYHLEDGISGGHCGIQDQAAAVYGGVNRWEWHYANRKSIFNKDSLLNREGQKELSKHILVAYSGISHSSSNINHSWIEAFLSGHTRKGWIEANRIIHKLSQSIKERNWEKAIKLLRAEMDIRRVITPDALIDLTEKLIDQAEEVGCAARFTGAGGGGSVWALGKPAKLIQLKKWWEMTLAPTRGGKILECSIESVGVK